MKTDEEKELLNQILKDTDTKFLRWAVHAIVTWKNEERATGIFHIHGTRDYVLPCRYSGADLKLKNGGHFIVFNRADEISFKMNEFVYF